MPLKKKHEEPCVLQVRFIENKYVLEETSAIWHSFTGNIFFQCMKCYFSESSTREWLCMILFFIFCTVTLTSVIAHGCVCLTGADQNMLAI